MQSMPSFKFVKSARVILDKGPLGLNGVLLSLLLFLLLLLLVFSEYFVNVDWL